MASPDWAKFGLNNEKQPLNPGGSGAAGPGQQPQQPGPNGASPSASKNDGQERALQAPGMGAAAAGGGGTLFGGHVQSDNELFADDQVTTTTS